MGYSTTLKVTLCKIFETSEEAGKWLAELYRVVEYSGGMVVSNTLVKDQLRIESNNHKIEKSEKASEKQSKTRFLIKNGRRYIIKDVREVAYFFADGKYVYLVCHDGARHLVEYTLDELEALVEEAIFYRINRNMILKIDAVKEFNQFKGGRLKVSINPAHKEEIYISREKAVSFKNWANL